MLPIYTIDDCPNLACKDCVWFKHDADRTTSICKQIDHKTVKFYKPCFSSLVCGDNHMPCYFFEPKYTDYADIKGKWTNFEDYKKVYVDAWLPKPVEYSTVGFVLNDNYDIVYEVPLEVFWSGKVIKDGILQANKKISLKRTREGFGYKLEREDIKGVCVDEYVNTSGDE